MASCDFIYKGLISGSLDFTEFNEISRVLLLPNHLSLVSYSRIPFLYSRILLISLAPELLM